VHRLREREVARAGRWLDASDRQHRIDQARSRAS
jgi:hypothetical protein